MTRSVARAVLLLFFSFATVLGQEGILGGSIDFLGQLELREFVQIPDAAGARPRLNDLTFSGVPGDNRLFVVDEGGSLATTGTIYAIDPGAPGGPSVTTFLNVGAAVLASTGRVLSHSNVHSGIRSVAFHPDYGDSGADGFGKIYTSILENKSGGINTEFNYLGSSHSSQIADSVLVEWTLDQQSGLIDQSSYRELFRVGLPAYDHPIKRVRFNPFANPGDEDYGLLYISHGDAGTQNEGTGQVGGNALGKLLRIDPLQDTVGGSPYSVPASNPFTADANVLDEVYALGFRNPHNISFAQDNQNNTRLILADIGQGNVEELNLILAGHNYGWREREGTFVNTSGSASALPANESANAFTFPVAQYGHFGGGIAIAGGFVLTSGPNAGEYVFGDFPESGRVFHATFEDLLTQTTMGDAGDLTQETIEEFDILFDHDDDPNTPSIPTTWKDIVRDDPNYSGGSRIDTRLGQGPDGTLYFLNKRNGHIYQVVPAKGDFNLDGRVDLSDIDLLGLQIEEGTNGALFDLNNDDLVNQDDLTLFLGGNIITAGNKLNGDADFDGTISFADFLTLSANFGQDGKKWSEGDFIANGRIEFDDFVALSSNFGETADSVVQVPELTAMALAWLGIPAWLHLRRRKKNCR